MIRFQNTNQLKKFNVYKTKKWLKNIILQEGKRTGDIVYLFCNDNYLLKKNIKYLNHNYLTDIITFDYCEKNIISGDILISVERVEENSKIFNVDFSIELNRVMAHGLLHLLGYKDKKEEEKVKIRKKENFYLKKFK
tara:strand:+ start:7008 stop:7418 length:411 start_codon:yes stop_codon:yes gene_type:complete